MDSQAMNKFDCLLGDWDLEYHIPKSSLSEAGSDSGVGSFTKVLDGMYVVFDYSTTSGSEAKGIFAWDDKARIYRYWWFENSGQFLSASCNFVNDDTLAMNWHDSLLVQTFSRDGPDRVVLRMSVPADAGGYDLVLEVILTRKQSL